MIEAILFDMDGVIIDSEPIHEQAYYSTFEELGITVPQEIFNSLKGKSTINVCNTLREMYNLQESAKAIAAMKRHYFFDIFDNDATISLIDGALELIQNYAANNLTMVLASSATMNTINAVFSRFDLDKYFVAKVSGADLKESKPNPEIFEKAVEASGCKRGRCVVVEDATNGIEAAKRAGVRCIALRSPNSHNQDYSQATAVINHFTEIHYEKLLQLVD